MGSIQIISQRVYPNVSSLQNGKQFSKFLHTIASTAPRNLKKHEGSFLKHLTRKWEISLKIIVMESSSLFISCCLRIALWYDPCPAYNIPPMNCVDVIYTAMAFIVRSPRNLLCLCEIHTHTYIYRRNFYSRQFLIKITFIWLCIELFRSKTTERTWNMQINQIHSVQQCIKIHLHK